MRLKFILHSKLTEIELQNIILLKKYNWDYSTEEHKIWIENNILNDDIHVIMKKDGYVIGYLNLVKTEVLLNDQKYFFWGIGNVCTLEKGLGFGKELLIKTQKYLIINNYKGFLFCKDHLVGFYNKFGWELVPTKYVTTDKFKDVNIMFYNVDVSYKKVEYNGRNF
jgi:predicted GNAT family N-acyltransferase